MNQFSVGGVLSKSFSIWFRNFVPFTIVSAIVYLPFIIYTAIVINDPTLERIGTWQMSLNLVPRVLGFIATGAVTFGVFQQLRGQHASMGRSIAVGLQRLVPVLVVSIVVAVIIALGFLALVVPGVILSLMLFVAVPVAIIERPGIAGSLKRSADLTKGYKGTIFGALFLLGIIQVVILLVIQGATIGMQPQSMDDFVNYIIGVTIFTILGGSLQAVVGAVAYHDLRVSKEGVATEELARVFD